MRSGSIELIQDWRLHPTYRETYGYDLRYRCAQVTQQPPAQTDSNAPICTPTVTTIKHRYVLQNTLPRFMSGLVILPVNTLLFSCC